MRRRWPLRKTTIGVTSGIGQKKSQQPTSTTTGTVQRNVTVATGTGTGTRPRPQPIAGTPPPDPSEKCADQKMIQQTCTLFGLDLVSKKGWGEGECVSFSFSTSFRVVTRETMKRKVYGILFQERPPPLPPSRSYTVTGNTKLGYPQTRIMKMPFPGKRMAALVKVLSNLEIGAPFLIINIYTDIGIAVFKETELFLIIYMCNIYRFSFSFLN